MNRRFKLFIIVIHFLSFLNYIISLGRDETSDRKKKLFTAKALFVGAFGEKVNVYMF